MTQPSPMKCRLSVALIAMAAAAVLSGPCLAQEPGDAGRGSAVALETCAGCHGVRKGEQSLNPKAPPFGTIAEVSGMTAMALNVALLTSHPVMPNIRLEPGERSDVIAYIQSLKAAGR
jgi:mono/diheme cytochrome c family protein